MPLTLSSLFYLIHVVIAVDDLMGGHKIHYLAGWQLGLQYHDPVGILLNHRLNRFSASSRHHSTTLLRAILQNLRQALETCHGQAEPNARRRMNFSNTLINIKLTLKANVCTHNYIAANIHIQG